MRETLQQTARALSDIRSGPMYVAALCTVALPLWIATLPFFFPMTLPFVALGVLGLGAGFIAQVIPTLFAILTTALYYGDVKAIPMLTIATPFNALCLIGGMLGLPLLAGLGVIPAFLPAVAVTTLAAVGFAGAAMLVGLGGLTFTALAAKLSAELNTPSTRQLALGTLPLSAMAGAGAGVCLALSGGLAILGLGLFTTVGIGIVAGGVLGLAATALVSHVGASLMAECYQLSSDSRVVMPVRHTPKSQTPARQQQYLTPGEAAAQEKRDLQRALFESLNESVEEEEEEEEGSNELITMHDASSCDCRGCSAPADLVR